MNRSTGNIWCDWGPKPDSSTMLITSVTTAYTRGSRKVQPLSQDPWSGKARQFLDTPFCLLPFSVPLHVCCKRKAKRRVLNPRYSHIIVCGSLVPSTNQFSTSSSGYFFLIHIQAATLLKALGSLGPRLPYVALAHCSSQPCSKHDFVLDPERHMRFN